MKQVIVRPAAAADIDDAYQWYEAQRPGLGEEFLVALNATRDRVVEQPEALSRLAAGYPTRAHPEALPLRPVLPGLWRHHCHRRLHACKARSAAMATSFVMANNAFDRTAGPIRSPRPVIASVMRTDDRLPPKPVL